MEALRRRIADGDVGSVYLVVGDLVVGEPAGRQLAEALAERLGVQAEPHRRPAGLARLLGDLKTYSLFDPGKVRLVVESALLADRAAAAGLIDEAAEALPVEAGSELTPRQRVGATRLLQALRLFSVDPAEGDAEAVLAALPVWALQGGPRERKKRNQRPRGKRQVAELLAGLEPLLLAAREDGLVGWAEGDLAELADAAESGLPEGHHLVLVESAAQSDHPVVERIAAAGNLLEVGSVSVDRRGAIEGVDTLAEALREETGVAIRGDALRELTQRTIRSHRGGVDAVSTGRLAAEYRKLANLAASGTIDREMVETAVEDRGEEDVFGLLDDISAGDVGAALRRLERHLQGAEDEGAAVFGFFALLGQYAQHVAAVRGMLEHLGARRVERNYNRFKRDLAPRLQAAPAAGLANPLSGLHPFRLHRVYLAAARWSSLQAKRLPWLVFEAETRLKGDSSNPATVLSDLVARLAHATVGATTTGRRGRKAAGGGRRA
ncbi:MAG: hypothetical protein DWQ36_04965 [Acidobacteria bacterium]|nr:MAG: hypothetical protein DWQ30_10555 [Acidobacteriota bacterium]REK10137.1 MAG: hypothetical protein DWQ36_04965 [Acidobacteriota bacterium]